MLFGACSPETIGVTPSPSGDDGDAGGQAGGDTHVGDTAAGDITAGDPGQAPGDSAGDASGDATSSGDTAAGDPMIVAFTCSSCHGNDLNNAPPLGLAGKTALTETGVGAHQSHVLDSSWHRAVECVDCHQVPQAIGDIGHMDTPLPAELTWGFPANADSASVSWDGTTCTNYCHGQTLEPGGSLLDPAWTTVNGSQAACGTCHGLPPAGLHPSNNTCELCHDEVITSFNAADPASSIWADASLHVDGQVQRGILGCTSCHGDAGTGHINPPLGTGGETDTTEAAVGAHEVHLTPANWHRDVTCTDCHAFPGMGHPDGTTDYSWGGPSGADGANPSYTATTCNNVYCHGTTLYGPTTGDSVARTPDWTEVDGTWDSCGDTCHTLPPAGAHPAVTGACELCHDEVISSFDATTPANSIWADASRHIDGTVDISNLTCTTCHGNASSGAINPPLGTNGETDTTDAAVGAHEVHLTSAGWHRDVVCNDCHATPSSLAHSDGVTDFNWGGPSGADGANPTYTATTCDNVYCHGATLYGPIGGGSVDRAPDWIEVDGTWDSCGDTCHTLPPAGAHPVTVAACELCHDEVISAYDATTPANSTWAAENRHIDGVVDVGALTCTTCHGNATSGAINPPLGTNNETDTTDAAVGAHEVHLAAAGWHRDVTCDDCHASPASTSHSDDVTDFSWGFPSNAYGANPVYSFGSTTCTNTYCHGATLFGARSGGTVDRVPDWTEVNGTWDSCGDTCHTNPPGETHPAGTSCEQCHSEVITSYTPTLVWNDASRHIDGVKDAANYHDLTNWTSPRDDAEHHGSNYFLTNGQRDEHDTACSSCHGIGFGGGTSGVSCNDSTCHSGNWRSCDYCHGQPPPDGVGGETTTDTLAVGRHNAHVTASSSHVAFSCDTCHVVPATNDVSHASDYVPSADLDSAGHHGDVSFSGEGTGTTWDVTDTQGTAPVTARGSCIGACHSNGRGGNPQVTPYWAGGSWTTPCNNCHAEPNNSGKHDKHVNDKNVPCSDCHYGVLPNLHLNGQPDVVFAPGGDMTFDPSGCSNGRCSDTCHDGEDHGTKCW